MNNQGFQDGFIKTCMARGLNAQQTEDLYEVANYARAFNNKDVKEQFNNAVVKEASADNLSMIAKARFIKLAVKKLYS